QRPDTRLQTQLFFELAPQRRVERFVTLEPAARQHPVALTALAVLDEQDLALADDDRRHAQLRRDRAKGLHQGRQADQRCAHRSAGPVPILARQLPRLAGPEKRSLTTA